MERHRQVVLGELERHLPIDSPANLYGLLGSYPRRPAKGLRPALCLATCRALGGTEARAVNAAMAVELFHNGFLIHDDIQDESQLRRGLPTLSAEHGVGIALNVGNAMNLLGLQCLMEDRWQLGPGLAWRMLEQTELMMRHSLEGQALELVWIRDNVVDLRADDYLRMCLKKTSWYTCLYPCRIGALIATSGRADASRFDRFGWYLGAAFQIQDDLLNLTADVSDYGKEICGDLWEAKRTLMLIDLLAQAGRAERARLTTFLAKRRIERTPEEVAWVHRRIVERGCIDRARNTAEELADAAQREVELAFAGAPETDDLHFLRYLPRYVIQRTR